MPTMFPIMELSKIDVLSVAVFAFESKIALEKLVIVSFSAVKDKTADPSRFICTPVKDGLPERILFINFKNDASVGFVINMSFPELLVSVSIMFPEIVALPVPSSIMPLILVAEEMA